MLADSRDLLTKENLKKGWNKLWPDNKETREDNENEARMAENVREVAHLCQSIRELEDFDEYDTAKWLDIDRNDMGFKILSDIVNTVQVSGGQDDSESEDDVSQASASAPTHAEAFTVLETLMSWYEHSRKAMKFNFCS